MAGRHLGQLEKALPRQSYFRSAQLRPRDLGQTRSTADDERAMAAELNSEDRVLYFYGITRERPADSIDQPGVDLQSKIYSVDCEGLACWVSRVSALEYGDDLARNMENPDWLATAS